MFLSVREAELVAQDNRTNYNLRRLASIIDYPEESLPEDVWVDSGDDNIKLRSEIKEDIYSRIHKFYIDQRIVGFNRWEVAYLLGSSIGTQFYSDDSDIDVKVLIDYDKFVEENPQYTTDRDFSELIKSVRQSPITSESNPIFETKRPLDVYFYDAKDLSKIELKKYDSLYLIDEDRWIKEPKKIPLESYDRESIIGDALGKAEQIAEKLDVELGVLKRRSIDFLAFKEFISRMPKQYRPQLEEKLAAKLKEIENEVIELTKEREDIKDERGEAFKNLDFQLDLEHFVTSLNFAEGNLKFKLLQKYGYLKILSDLKELISDDNKIEENKVSDIKEILAAAGDGSLRPQDGSMPKIMHFLMKGYDTAVFNLNPRHWEWIDSRRSEYPSGTPGEGINGQELDLEEIYNSANYEAPIYTLDHIGSKGTLILTSKSDPKLPQVTIGAGGKLASNILRVVLAQQFNDQELKDMMSKILEKITKLRQDKKEIRDGFRAQQAVKGKTRLPTMMDLGAHDRELYNWVMEVYPTTIDSNTLETVEEKMQKSERQIKELQFKSKPKEKDVLDQDQVVKDEKWNKLVTDGYKKLKERLDYLAQLIKKLESANSKKNMGEDKLNSVVGKIDNQLGVKGEKISSDDNIYTYQYEIPGDKLDEEKISALKDALKRTGGDLKENPKQSGKTQYSFLISYPRKEQVAISAKIKRLFPGVFDNESKTYLKHMSNKDFAVYRLNFELGNAGGITKDKFNELKEYTRSKQGSLTLEKKDVPMSNTITVTIPNKVSNDYKSFSQTEEGKKLAPALEPFIKESDIPEDATLSTVINTLKQEFYDPIKELTDAALNVEHEKSKDKKKDFIRTVKDFFSKSPAEIALGPAKDFGDKVLSTEQFYS